MDKKLITTDVSSDFQFLHRSVGNPENIKTIF